MTTHRWIRAGALLVLTGALAGVCAQRAAAQMRTRARAAHVTLGVRTMDFAAVNERLAANQYPTLDSEMFTLGFGGYQQFDRFLIGVDLAGFGTSPKETANGDYKVGVSGGIAQFDLGYAALQRDRLLLYPLVGIGGAGTTLQLQHNREVPFDDMLADPGRSSSATIGAFVITPTIALEYVIAAGSPRRGIRGLALGLQSGYTLTSRNGSWHMHQSDLAAGPTLDLDGFFVVVTMGSRRLLRPAM